MALTENEIQALVEMFEERRIALNQARDLETLAREHRDQASEHIQSAREKEKEARALRDQYRQYSAPELAKKFDISREYVYRVAWRYR